MSCRQWENDIALYAGGDLTDSRAVEAHLAGCPACAALAEELGALRVELQALTEPSAVEVARVVARARAASAPRPRWWLVAAAAMLAIVAVGLLRTNEKPAVVGRVVVARQPLPDGRGSVAAVKVQAKRQSRRRVETGREAGPTEVVMRLETDDPDVVFYLSSDSKGEQP